MGNWPQRLGCWSRNTVRRPVSAACHRAIRDHAARGRHVCATPPVFRSAARLRQCGGLVHRPLLDGGLLCRSLGDHRDMAERRRRRPPARPDDVDRHGALYKHPVHWADDAQRDGHRRCCTDYRRYDPAGIRRHSDLHDLDRKALPTGTRRGRRGRLRVSNRVSSCENPDAYRLSCRRGYDSGPKPFSLVWYLARAIGQPGRRDDRGFWSWRSCAGCCLRAYRRRVPSLAAAEMERNPAGPSCDRLCALRRGRHRPPRIVVCIRRSSRDSLHVVFDPDRAGFQRAPHGCGLNRDCHGLFVGHYRRWPARISCRCLWPACHTLLAGRGAATARHCLR